MKNKRILKGLVFGTIILFIGTNIFSNINAQIENYTSIDTNHFNNILNRKIIYVYCNSTYPGDGSKEWPYPNIWQAIENASDNDIILVHNCTYFEDVIVNKSVSLKGENQSNTFIYGDMTLIGDSILIENFSIGGGSTVDGLYLESCFNCTVRNCFSNLLSMNNSDANKVTDCRFNSQTWGCGAKLYNSNLNDLRKNIFEGSAYLLNNGLVIRNSDNNTITDNYCRASPLIHPVGSTCLIVDSSNGNIIIHNFCMESDVGMQITNSHHNTIHYNKITSNSLYGMRLESNSFENTISNNTIENNLIGIWFKNSFNNKVLHNNIKGIANNYSIYLSVSKGDEIHFNNIEGTNLVLLYAERSYSSAILNWWGGLLGPLFRTFRFGLGIVFVRPALHKKISNNCPDP